MTKLVVIATSSPVLVLVIDIPES